MKRQLVVTQTFDIVPEEDHYERCSGCFFWSGDEDSWCPDGNCFKDRVIFKLSSSDLQIVEIED